MSIRPGSKTVLSDARAIAAGDRFRVTLNPDAIRFDRSFDVIDGSDILLHIVVRRDVAQVIANHRIDGAWGEERKLGIEPGEILGPIVLDVAVEDAATVIALDDERSLHLDRVHLAGRSVVFQLPPGVTAKPDTGAADAEEDSPPSTAVAADGADPGASPLRSWLTAAARGRTLAILGTLSRRGEGLAEAALAAGADIATLVATAALDDPRWGEAGAGGAHPTAAGRLRMVSAALSDPDLAEQIGPHDLVVCRDVILCVPDPISALARLRAMTRWTCLLSLAILPDHLFGAMSHLDLTESGPLFGPTLSDAARNALAALPASADAPAHEVPGAATEWMRSGEANCDVRWWFLTRAQVERFVALAGFEIVQAVEATPGRLDLELRPG